MNLLDQNIRRDQEEHLRQWGIRCRWLTHDRDYFKRELVHPAYGLVWLDMFDGQAAEFIRRFLRQPDFATHVRRLGKVVRVHPQRLTF